LLFCFRVRIALNPATGGGIAVGDVKMWKLKPGKYWANCASVLAAAGCSAQQVVRHGVFCGSGRFSRVNKILCRKLRQPGVSAGTACVHGSQALPKRRPVDNRLASLVLDRSRG